MNLSKTTFRSSELDGLLNQSFATIAKQAEINAETYANRNLPAPGSTDIGPFYNELHHKFQCLLDEIKRHLQGSAGIDEVVGHGKLADRRIQDAQNQRSLAREQAQLIATKMQGMEPPYSIKKMTAAYALIVLLSLGDGLFNLGVFTSWRSGYLEALGMALFFALLIAVIAHFFKWIVAFGKSPAQKRLITAGVFLVMLSLFSFMAISRSAYLEQQDYQETRIRNSYSPVPFVIISMLIFTACVILSAVYCPTRQQQQEMREYLMLLEQHIEQQAEIDRLEALEHAIRQEHLALRQLHASVLDYGEACELLAMSRAREALETFKKHNMTRRQDNCRPVSFDSVEYPFTFITNFQRNPRNP